MTSKAASRRQFLATTGIGIAVAGTLDTVFGTTAHADAAGYGPLTPDPLGVLDLPEGFTYRAFSAEDEEIAPGVRVPGAHDGMATFGGHGHRSTILVRNHELTKSGVKAVAPPELTYDPAAYGGTTTLEVSSRGGLVRQYVSLAGTSTNCAGGRTPWGSWLTCEETEGFSGQTKSHGWVFEVDPYGGKTVPTPIEPLGRFAHEAVAIDPVTSQAYLTEDAKGPFGLFYRFTPAGSRRGFGEYRKGGLLEALQVPSVPDLAAITEPGTVLRGATWVKVPDPAAATTSTRKQFDTITRAQKLEGCWWGRNSVYFVSSYGRVKDGAAGEHVGQVWRFRPRLRQLLLELIFKPGGVYDAPDNITVSPYGGGVILAEDGDGEQFLVGVNRRGEPFSFARNAFNDSEFAGVTFSSDGRVLYANRQSPGVTFAITGPWHALSG